MTYNEYLNKFGMFKLNEAAMISRNFEILEFKNNTTGEIEEYDRKLIKDVNYSIHSVLRTKDNSVFSIGDGIDDGIDPRPEPSKYKLKSLEIQPNGTLFVKIHKPPFSHYLNASERFESLQYIPTDNFEVEDIIDYLIELKDYGFTVNIKLNCEKKYDHRISKIRTIVKYHININSNGNVIKKGTFETMDDFISFNNKMELYKFKYISGSSAISNSGVNGAFSYTKEY
jgi:hypothetical protein